MKKPRPTGKGTGAKRNDGIVAPTRTATSVSVNTYLGVPEDWPVVEHIKHAICLMPSAADIRRGKQHDPCRCALANAACRLFDVPGAAVGAKVAYIPQRDAKGRPYIARVKATAATKRAIAEFDRTGAMPPGGFTFIPIEPRRHLEAMREYSANWRASGGTRRKAGPRTAPTRGIPRTFNERG